MERTPMQPAQEEWQEGQSMHSASGAVPGSIGRVQSTIPNPFNCGSHAFDPEFDGHGPFDDLVNRNYHPAGSVPYNITGTNYVVDEGYSPFVSGFGNFAAPNATVYQTPYARIPNHSIAGLRDNVAHQGFPLVQVNNNPTNISATVLQDYHSTTFSFNGLAAPYSFNGGHQDFMATGFGSLSNASPVFSQSYEPMQVGFSSFNNPYVDDSLPDFVIEDLSSTVQGPQSISTMSSNATDATPSNTGHGMQRTRKSRSICTTCNKSFSRPSDLARHMKKRQPGARIYQCTESNCDYMCSYRKDKLADHVKICHK